MLRSLFNREKLTPQQEAAIELLRSVGVKKYTIRDDGMIAAHGDINL